MRKAIAIILDNNKLKSYYLNSYNELKAIKINNNTDIFMELELLSDNENIKLQDFNTDINFLNFNISSDDLYKLFFIDFFNMLGDYLKCKNLDIVFLNKNNISKEEEINFIRKISDILRFSNILANVEFLFNDCINDGKGDFEIIYSYLMNNNYKSDSDEISEGIYISKYYSTGCLLINDYLDDMIPTKLGNKYLNNEFVWFYDFGHYIGLVDIDSIKGKKFWLNEFELIRNNDNTLIPISFEHLFNIIISKIEYQSKINNRVIGLALDTEYVKKMGIIHENNIYPIDEFLALSYFIYPDEIIDIKHCLSARIDKENVKMGMCLINMDKRNKSFETIINYSNADLDACINSMKNIKNRFSKSKKIYIFGNCSEVKLFKEKLKADPDFELVDYKSVAYGASIYGKLMNKSNVSLLSSNVDINNYFRYDISRLEKELNPNK